MNLVFGIALLVASFLVISVIVSVKKEIDDTDAVTFAVAGAVVATSLIAGTYLIDEYRSPNITPMDVYRGKTTLEINYRDSIAIDSTVVWKDKRE